MIELKETSNIRLPNHLKKLNYKILIGNTEFIDKMKESIIPNDFELYQNYPNPFNPSTMIKYEVPKESKVNIRIFNVLGELVEVLFENKLHSPGLHEAKFDASRLSSGVYIYKIESPGFIKSRKMVLMR